LVLAVLLPLALMLSNLTKTGSLGEDVSKGGAGTTTTFVETRQTQVQTTTYETIIYSATRLPKAKQYALFEIIVLLETSHFQRFTSSRSPAWMQFTTSLSRTGQWCRT
jgi:hypothetical protein